MRACTSSAQQDDDGDEASVEDELAKLQELQNQSGGGKPKGKPKAGGKPKGKRKTGGKPKGNAEK